MTYVLALEGPEGIEDLLWAGHDSFEAECKFNEVIKAAKKWREQFLKLEEEKWKMKEIHELLERQFGTKVDISVACGNSHFVVYGLEGTDKRICFVEEE